MSQNLKKIAFAFNNVILSQFLIKDQFQGNNGLSIYFETCKVHLNKPKHHNFGIHLNAIIKKQPSVCVWGWVGEEKQ